MMNRVKLLVSNILNSKFESIREYNIAYCELLNFPISELRKEFFSYKNTSFHNQAGFIYEQLYSAHNNGLIPDGFYDPKIKKELEDLHRFEVHENPYDFHARRWNLKSGFPTRLLKQYKASGSI